MGLAYRSLVWDFGGPVLLTPFELRAQTEQRLGLPPDTFPWSGPFDPAADPDWQELLAGEFTERQYWARRGDDYAAIDRGTGGAEGLRRLMCALYDADEDDLIRPEPTEITTAARAAGMSVGILTNDLQAFHGAEWASRISFLSTVDVVVDGSVEGLLKPDPRAYELICSRLGVAAGEVLLVDDQPANLAGAAAVGMAAVAFDVTDRAVSYELVRSRLGL